MSRGGRGGAMVSGGHMRGQALPFDVDPELVEEADQRGVDSDDDFAKEIFPSLTEYVMARPITDEERRGVQTYRELQAKRTAGPFWTGTREDWAEIDSARGGTGSFDPFETMSTYGKKRSRKAFKLADLSKVKLDKQFFPKELWAIIGATKEEEGDDATDGGPPKRQKRLGLAKKATLDKLAKFDEGREDEGEAASADDEEGEKLDEDEEFERAPGDDDFDEDDDDADNDYNAELYFDGGEDDFEDMGGDEYGGDEGY